MSSFRTDTLTPQYSRCMDLPPGIALQMHNFRQMPNPENPGFSLRSEVRRLHMDTECPMNIRAIWRRVTAENARFIDTINADGLRTRYIRVRRRVSIRKEMPLAFTHPIPQRSKSILTVNYNRPAAMNNPSLTRLNTELVAGHDARIPAR